MISVVAVVVAALALLVAFAVIVVIEGRRDREHLEARRDAWARIDAREAALDAREAAWAEERAGLLDRIQAPHMTAARLLPSGDGAEDEFQTDAEVDKAFQQRPESVVPWDPDLVPLPWEVTTSDDVPQPTVEPVRP